MNKLSSKDIYLGMNPSFGSESDEPLPKFCEEMDEVAVD